MSAGKLGQLSHQLEPFRTDAFQLFNAGGIVLLLRQAKIFEAHRIKIVVRQRDEAETEAAQIDDFVQDNVGSPGPGLLTIRAPYRTK